jgi:flagellin-like protein
MFNSKGISPVVATALLLVVTVVSAVGFQTWFTSFESSLLVEIESESSDDTQVRIEQIYGDTLFFHSESYQSLEIMKIIDSVNGSEMCLFDGSSPTDSFNTTRFILNFNDGTANDTSEFAHEVTAEGNIDCSVQGVSGTGCYFDQVDDTIILEANQTFNVYPLRSFSFWMNTNTSTNARVLGQQDTGATSGNLQSTGNRLIGMYNQTPSEIICNFPGGYGAHNNLWTHIVLIQNRDSGGNSFIKGYVNGELVCNEDVGVISSTFNSDMHIGSRTNKDSYYGGFIDEFSLYEAELSANDVQTLYETKQALAYEAIVPKGSRSFDVSNCNLVRDKSYDVVLITNKGSAQEKIIKK